MGRQGGREGGEREKNVHVIGPGKYWSQAVQDYNDFVEAMQGKPTSV